MGVRSSWLTLATRSRRWRSTSASSADIWLKARARSPTSSREVAVTRREWSPRAMARAAAAISRSGLVMLAAKPGVVFTREHLLAEVWGYRDGSGLRTVDSHVRALRRKLGAKVIRTVHGVGYAAEG